MAVQISTLNILSEFRFPPEQAQGLVRILDVEKDAWRHGLATREDLNTLKTELKDEISDVRHDLEIKVKGLQGELKEGISEVRQELIRLEMRLFMKMAGTMITAITITLAVLRIFRTAF